MELDASLSWLALALTPGLGSRLSARVLRKFGSPDGVFRASLADLESCNLPAQAAQAMVKKESFKRAEKEPDGVRKIANCRLLNWTEPEYPQTLLQIYDLPVLLYVRGDVQVLNLPSLSIVGTRRPTLYGTQMARRLGRELAARGLVIVSGWLAALTPSGIKGLWIRMGAPSESSGRALMFATRRKTRSYMRKFSNAEPSSLNSLCGLIPHRRIFPYAIASSQGCRSEFVIEGAQYSGSLITARLAMEFGREVFGVPGNVTQPVSFAPNQLVKQGAKLVTNADDVIEELPTPVRAALVQAEQPEAEQRNLLAAASLNGSEKKLYELLSADEPKPIDDIVEHSGLNSSEVLATLFNLEMKGIIRQLPGKQFSKVLL